MVGPEELTVRLPSLAISEAQPLLAACLDRHRQADGATGASGQLGDGRTILLVDQDARLGGVGDIRQGVDQRLVDEELVGADPCRLRCGRRLAQSVEVAFQTRAVVGGQDEKRFLHHKHPKSGSTGWRRRSGTPDRLWPRRHAR